MRWCVGLIDLRLAFLSNDFANFTFKFCLFKMKMNAWTGFAEIVTILKMITCTLY